MSLTYRVFRSAAVVLLAASLGACAQTYAKRTVTETEAPLDQSGAKAPGGEPLSVRIEAFDPGKLPEDPNHAKGLSPEIRNAEAYYVPVQIKNTMQRSGYWGPVRVVPKGSREGEVIVTGRIEESDGEILKLSISVKDATGRPWFTKTYERVIDEAQYRNASGVDPFQGIYNEIANDIAAHRKKLPSGDTVAVRQVAELRFGADFAPDVFGAYLKKPAEKDSKPDGDDTLKKLVALFDSNPTPDDATLYKVRRLPSPNDPMIARVNRIRAREEYLIDTLDQQYDGLARNLAPAYTRWRESRLKEINAVRAVDDAKAKQQSEAIAIGVLGALAGAAVGSQRNCYSCQTTGAVIAGAAIAVAVKHAVDASDQASAETKLRMTTLVEIGKSISDDVKPVVVEVEGRTVELKGSVDQKFDQWRRVLKELSEQENGPQQPAPAPAPKRDV